MSVDWVALFEFFATFFGMSPQETAKTPLPTIRLLLRRWQPKERQRLGSGVPMNYEQVKALVWAQRERLAREQANAAG